MDLAEFVRRLSPTQIQALASVSPWVRSMHRRQQKREEEAARAAILEDEGVIVVGDSGTTSLLRVLGTLTERRSVEVTGEPDEVEEIVIVALDAPTAPEFPEIRAEAPIRSRRCRCGAIGPFNHAPFCKKKGRHP